MLIKLSQEQEECLLSWSGKIVEENINSGCEPPGYELIISISSFGQEAEAVCGAERLDLGDICILFNQV